MRKFDESTFSPPSEKLEILKDSIDFFTTNGYKMVGMDHFAKPEDELFKAIEKGELHRNFQGYTTKGGADLIGIGVTSIGDGVDYYAQNFKDLKTYEDAIDKGELPVFKGYKLNLDDQIRQFVIMEIMSNFSLNIKRVEEKFNIDWKNFHKNLTIIRDSCTNLFGMSHFYVKGCEADDLMAILSRHLPGKKVILSADKDLTQLIDQDTIQVNPFDMKLKLMGDGIKSKEEFVKAYAIAGQGKDDIPQIRKRLGLKTALKYFKKALRYHFLDKVLINKARALLQLRKHKETIETADKILRYDIKNSDAWNLKGEALKKLHEIARAGQCFKKAEEHKKVPRSLLE